MLDEEHSTLRQYVFSTAFTSIVMMPVERRESGGEKDGDEKFWGEGHTSGSAGNSQHVTNNSNARDASTAKDQESQPNKPDETQSVTSQNEQQRPALQEPVTTSRHLRSERIREILSRHVKSFGTLRNARQETIHPPRLASSGPAEIGPHEKLAHTDENAEEDCQESLVAVGGQSKHLTNPEQVRAGIGSLDDSEVHPPATGNLGSVGRRNPPSLEIQLSLGEIIETKNKKIKGKVWVAKGPALELFEAQIRPKIENLLVNTEPPQCAPLLLTLYMIGKSEMRASPVIMICCCDRKVRKDAEATIRESDILQQFPQMRLGNSATLLEANSFVVPATGRPILSRIDARSFSNIEEEHIIGRRLRLVDKIEGTESVRYATGGPFVRIDNCIYQLTAFHYGQTDAGNRPAPHLDSDPDECEYDGQSDTEEDENDLEADTEEEMSLKESAMTGMDNESTLFSMPHNTDVVLEQHDRQDPQSPQTLRNRRTVDYDLARLPAAEASKASNTVGDSKNGQSFQITNTGAPPIWHTPVVVVTTYDHLAGAIIPGTKRVKMHGFHGFQDLITARLSCSIKPGDSGSAVLDASTGCFYGHIVLGSAPDTLVYIVPSVSIFASANAVFGETPALNLEGPVMNPSMPMKVVARWEHPLSAFMDPGEPNPIPIARPH